MRTLTVEGWRFILHSYAVVNQFQCLELVKFEGVSLAHVDLPFYRSSWKSTRNLFGPNQEEILRHLPVADSDSVSDVTYRIAFPFRVEPSASARTYVFATAEFHTVPPDYIAKKIPLAEAMRGNEVQIVTPSNWSRSGFLSSGAPPERVHVVPLGVDPAIYAPPSRGTRDEIRKNMRIGPEEFVFLSVGAMSPNKGIDILLRAFSDHVKRHPTSRVYLKGTDSLYGCRDALKAVFDRLDRQSFHRVRDKVTYFGGSMSFSDMAKLFQMADAYVSPYRAEGFNMPVLEAAACGLPVICTKGGSTDDFTESSFAMPIPSTIESRGDARMLSPDLTRLSQLMDAMVEDEAFRTEASKAGPALVSTSYSWTHIVTRLLELMFPAWPG